jgi:hypothetical protein
MMTQETWVVGALIVMVVFLLLFKLSKRIVRVVVGALVSSMILGAMGFGPLNGLTGSLGTFMKTEVNSVMSQLQTKAQTQAVGGVFAPKGATKSTGCVSLRGLPDPKCTPGSLNKDVTPATIMSTICVKGWTATVRPPVSYTEPLKKKLMRSYGVKSRLSTVELDHLIPLALGGNPRDKTNLWPEMWNGATGAHTKDKLEVKLQHLVCSGSLPLDVAQEAIATNWQAAAKTYLG